MNYNSFREYLNEWKKTPIDLNNKQYNIIKSSHVFQPRGEHKIPRDGNMNKAKYVKLITEASNYVDLEKQFAIIWKDGQLYSGFTGQLTDNNITIITAIMKQAKKSEMLFKNVTNRHVIEDLNKL